MKRLTRLSTFFFAIAIAGMVSGCSTQPDQPGAMSLRPSLALQNTGTPSNVGLIHNAGIRYLIDKYDTSRYSGFPHKLSLLAVDSLFSLYANDSMTISGSSPSPAQLAIASGFFNSALSRTAIVALSHAEFVDSLQAAVSAGAIANDECLFLRGADSLLRLCGTYSAVNSTLAGLHTTFNGTTWGSSQSHGVTAANYLSVADSSSALWSKGGTDIPCVSVAGDAAGFASGFASSIATDFVNGRSIDWGAATLNGIASGLAASFGPVGQLIGDILKGLF